MIEKTKVMQKGSGFTYFKILSKAVTNKGNHE